MIRPELTNVLLDQINSINYSIFGYDTDIDGWAELDKKVASSFEVIKSESSPEDNISFISFADTELNSDKVYQWEVEADKGKFFYAVCEPIEEQTDFEQINDYYFFKYVLSKTMEGGTEVERKLLANPKSAQLAYVLQKPFVYKIICVENDELTVGYNDTLNLLSVYIPKRWLDFNLDTEVDTVVSNIDYHSIIFDKKHYVYEIGNESLDVRNLRSSHADINLLKKHIKALSDLLIEQKVPIKQEKYCIEGFARLIVSLAYLAKKKNCCVESIPGVVAEKNKKSRCLGVFIWGYKGKNSPYTQYFKILAEKMCVCYAAKYIEPLKYVEKMHEAYTKSAKAAIMSRNMSHNIGSHVMSYLKQHLGSVKDIIADGILSDLINGENELDKKLNNTTENTTLPFLMGLGHFISYIQERQDFIATIATDYIPYFGNINVKDTIYDELNPDKRAERHTERTNGKTNNILLGNIARSEGLGRNNQSTSKRSGQLADIILNFQDSNNNVFDGNPVVNKDNTIVGRENAKKALEEMRKWEVSVPGGVIGRQAVFSIVENLIRNTAKHGNWRDQSRLELTFNYFTKDSLPREFCELKEKEADILRNNTDENGKQKKLSKKDEDELNNTRKSLEQWNQDAAPTEKPHSWDEDKKKHNSLMEVLWYFYGQSLDADDLYFVTITDNVKISEKAVDKLRTALVEDYIDTESKMIEGNKGIKEIRISAAWLRGAKNEEEYYNSGAKLIDPQTWKKAPLVYVRQHNGCLQYIICLQKPRKLAVVSWRLFSEESEKAFKKLNCRYYTPETYRKEKNKSFDFILFDDSNKDEKEEYSYESLKPISSSRFWKLSDIEELADKDEHGELELFKRLKDVTEESLNDILLLLYKKLSHYEAEDSIWIDDKTAAANVGRDTDGTTPKYIKSNYITVQDGISKGVRKYIYRTHHDSEKEYSNYIDAVNAGTIEGNIFVEGISGNNSTDRLVRNEKLDDIWFYKHLHAMKEQVAIFDERLFTKIFGLEESHLKDEGTFKIDDSNRDLYRERYYEEIINSDDEQYSSFVDENSLEEQDRILLENFKNETSPTTSKENVDAQNGVKPIVYKQKGVYVFTLIQDPNPKKQDVFNLYGLSETSSNTKAICKKIASLTWSQANGLEFDGEITSKDDNYINKYKRFDRISIHQGLLDKLYEVFGIKDEPQNKERLTRQFYQAFSSTIVAKTKAADMNPEKVNEKKNHPFLTGLCIHSGRSKPSPIDMPQKLPFIQYASIENAVLDCKYSLVELLDFARYE